MRIPSGRESIASRTDKAVRSILDAEVSERDAKTLRLRKQRLERKSIMPSTSKRVGATAGSVKLTSSSMIKDKGNDTKMTKARLIVVAAFDRNDAGELVAAFDPMAFETEGRALRAAAELQGKHIGVVAWSREADPDIGEYGPPAIFFQYGDIPDMD